MAKQLVNPYEKSEVKIILKMLSNVELDDPGSPLKTSEGLDYTSALNVDGTRRVYHKKSGFLQDHITSTSSDEWRSVFSAEQQDRLMDLSQDWLLRYEFKL